MSLLKTPYPMPRPAMPQDNMGMLSDADAQRIIQQTQGGSPNIMSRIGSGLLGGASRVGSGLLGAGRDIGRAVAPVAPQALMNIADTMRFYQAAQMQQPSLVTADDLDKLRPINPAGIAAMLPQLRAEEQAAIQKPILDEMTAMANLARAKGSGRSASMKHPTKHVDRETGREFMALFDERTGKFFDPSTNTILDSERYELAESAGMKSKKMPSFGEMLKLDEQIQDDANAIRSVKRFRNSLSQMEFGLKGKIDDVTAGIKNFFKGADSKLSTRQFYRSLSRAEQQGILGQIRESVVGGGVMTEFDAIRVLERMGGDVGSLMSANPEVFGRATKDIMNDIYRKAERRIMYYNKGAAQHDFDEINLELLVSDVPDTNLGGSLTNTLTGNDPLGLR